MIFKNAIPFSAEQIWIVEKAMSNRRVNLSQRT
jgi:hypothetical protein